MNELKIIDDKISKQLNCLVKNADLLIFKKCFEFDITKDKEKINDEIKKLNFKGLYLIELRINNSNLNFNEWIDDFKVKYEVYNSYSPRLIIKRIKEIKELGKNISMNNYLPFYIGKSRKISERIRKHLFYKFEQKTYALKLFERENLYDYQFRIRVINLDFIDNYDTILPKLEYEFRNKYIPIVGKQ